jgi:hypothetical protein
VTPALRYYTVEEANTALGRVRGLLERLREARAGLTDDEARAALTAATPTNGGGEPGREVSEAFLALRSAVLELQEMAVLVRDLDRGLVDFPAIREDREVFLCWEESEEAVEFWHERDAGHAGRQPL